MAQKEFIGGMFGVKYYYFKGFFNQDGSILRRVRFDIRVISSTKPPSLPFHVLFVQLSRLLGRTIREQETRRGFVFGIGLISGIALW